jgi:GH18 family chitinase
MRQLTARIGFPTILICGDALYAALMRYTVERTADLRKAGIIHVVTLSALLIGLRPGRVSAAAGPVENQHQGDKTNSLWVTGYYPAQSRIEPVAAIPWSKYSEINHFAACAGLGGDGRGDGTVSLHYLTPAEIRQFVAQAHAAGRKAIVTIKDNNKHLDAFSQNTTPGMIETFVRNMQGLVVSNAYDGVDIEWEAKVAVGPYVSFLSRLRHALGEERLITIAVGNWSCLESVAAQAQGCVDHINIMCYDMDDTRSYAWHNAALQQNGDADKMTCDWRVRAFTLAGVSRNKIGIGIPVYGRRWTGVSDPLQLNGLRSAGWVNYRDLVTDERRWQPAHQKWDSKYGADYLSIPALQEFDSYNGVRSIGEICRWARAEGFGGFMSFELSSEYLPGRTGDARYPVSTALWQCAHGGTSLGRP